MGCGRNRWGPVARRLRRNVLEKAPCLLNPRPEGAHRLAPFGAQRVPLRDNSVPLASSSERVQRQEELSRPTLRIAHTQIARRDGCYPCPTASLLNEQERRKDLAIQLDTRTIPTRHIRQLPADELLKLIVEPSSAPSSVPQPDVVVARLITTPRIRQCRAVPRVDKLGLLGLGDNRSLEG